MSATSKGAVKTPLIWLGAALGCVVITNVYALFGHGVRSDAMDGMFLYPLLGGTAVYLLTGFALKKAAVRPGSTIYNAGIATLTAGGMLRGILEIAGTGSAYGTVFTAVGWGLAGLGLLCWFAVKSA
ncbi:MAG: hypothetical protein LBR72_04490 [Oscillospiraceae bacterium]|jgi:hypothetical protein|nr:hypothetical protein [Oscillospiraceae bacterium]